MKITYGRQTIYCDAAYLEGGKLIIFQGGRRIMEIANIADINDYTVEGGEIEVDLKDDEALAIITGDITSAEALSIIRGEE